MLEFLAQHRVAVSTQVQALLDCDAGGANRRLRGLAKLGLVNRRRIFEGLPAACWITRTGLGVIGSRLPPPEPDLKEYRHDVGLAWLWLAARDGALGHTSAIVSERTMRSADRRGPAPGVRYGIGVGPGARVHYPDLLLEAASGHRIAVELELTGKGARRLDRIMLGYAGDPRIDAVLYLCPPGQLGSRVQAAARRAGISDLVHVQPLADGSPSGAPRALGAANRRAVPVRRAAREVRNRAPAAEL